MPIEETWVGSLYCRYRRDRSAGPPAQAAESVYKGLGKEERCCKSGGMSGNFGGAGSDLDDERASTSRSGEVVCNAHSMVRGITPVTRVQRSLTLLQCPLTKSFSMARRVLGKVVTTVTEASRFVNRNAKRVPYPAL
jgi:hypothetical protein